MEKKSVTSAFSVLSGCFGLFSAAVLFCSFCVSCAQIPFYRNVTVHIPEHPWEKYTGVSLWYSLCWNSGNDIERLYVDTETRTVKIKIPVGQTVFICAYPLGEMRPFGGAVSPLTESSTVLLNQNDGCLADLIMNSDAAVAKNVNYERLRTLAAEKTEDFRLIDGEALLKDILNGRLGSGSVNVTKPLEAGSFAMYSGMWISESVMDGRLSVSGGESPELELPYGINRYYNAERGLEIRFIISETSIYKHERTALVHKVM